MKRTGRNPLVLLLAGILPVLLAAGCGTTRPRNAATAEAPANADSALHASPRAEEAALEKKADAHAHYAAAVLHEMNDEQPQALEDYYQAALEDPTDDGLLLEVSERLLRARQPDKALKVLEPAARRRDVSSAVLARLGFVYAELGKDEPAIKADREAIQKDPRSLAGYHNLYLNYLQAKQPQAALGVLDEAAKVRNPGAEFLIGLAELYENYGQHFAAQRDAVRSKALAVLHRAAKLGSANPQLRLRLADGFHGAGDTKQAALLYLDLLKHLDDSPIVRELVRGKLAEIYLHSDHKKAIEQLQAIVHDDPANAPAYYYLGSIADDEKRWNDAIEYYKKALLFSPDLEQAYYDLARVQLGANNADDSLATLDRAQRKFGQSFFIEYLKGAAYSEQKHYQEAVSHFTAAEVIANATAPSLLGHVFYFQLGAARERNGEIAAAEKDFQRCLKMSPDFAEALNYLGYMWADRGTNLDQARVMIEKAVKLEPTNAAFIDSLGWVLFKQHEPAKALDYILKAVKLNAEPDATIYDHLGDIYATLKQEDKAREAWRKSLSVEPNEQIQKKLEAIRKE